MNAKSTLLLALLAAATALAAAPAPTVAPAGDSPLKRIEESPFGAMPDGTAIKLFTMRNHKGMTLKVMTWGAVITDIEAPDKDGKYANMVLSSPTFNTRFATWAQTIGRVANRIAGAKFTLDGNEYTLQANDSRVNTLHSGNANFGTKVYEGKALPEKEHETSAQFSLLSKDGDGGFPGNLHFQVTFTLTDDNEVRLDYEGTTDKTTLLAPTNHAYFNLGGGGSVLDDELWIDGDQYTPYAAATGAIPSGEFAPVKDTPFDFTNPAGTRVGNKIPQNTYDVNLVVNHWKPGTGPGGGANGPVLVARVTDPHTGRVMEVKTDQPGVQLYTGNNRPQNAIALETQHFADAIHHEKFPSTVLKPGETYKSTTIYAFSVKK